MYSFSLIRSPIGRCLTLRVGRPYIAGIHSLFNQQRMSLINNDRTVFRFNVPFDFVRPALDELTAWHNKCIRTDTKLPYEITVTLDENDPGNFGALYAIVFRMPFSAGVPFRLFELLNKYY
jgi:hypothetical protein